MNGFRLERVQVVPADISDVFEFFEDPLNLEVITPPWLNFHVVAVSTGKVCAGTDIQYRLRWTVFPMRWRSRISEYTKLRSFADEMTRGPYARWCHRHLFTPVSGGVEMRDVVDYELPFGPLGRLVHRLVVRDQLEAIFDYRREAISKIFGPPPS